MAGYDNDYLASSIFGQHDYYDTGCYWGIFGENLSRSQEKADLYFTGVEYYWGEIYMKHGLVSVIIPTYNRADCLERLVKSVINSDYERKEIIVVDNKLSVLKNTNLGDELENHLCVSWFNETLSDKNTNGKISTYKEELAKNLTLKAREIYQESWEGSQTRVFLNDLRRHITGGEFIHEWNNGVLSSIAAVLVAGDDWEKMYVYMQNKEYQIHH